MDIHRPPFLRSQSDNSSTTTIIPSSYPRFRTLDDFEHVQKGSNTVLGPRRPPRNPARTLVDTKSGFQPVPEARALTGTKEEVTPWELEPFPATFFETPPTAVVPTTSKQTSSVRPSSSSGGHHHSPGISFSDFYLLRRKSTGSHKSSSKAKVKAKMSTTNGHSLLQKQRVTPGPGLPPLPSLHNSSSPNLSSNGNASPRLAHKITSAISPHPYSLATSGTAGHTTTPPALSSSRPLRQPTTSFDQPFVASHPQSHPVASTSTSHTTTAPGSAALPAIGIQKSHSNPNSKSSSKSSIEQHADHQTANHLKFSTADRTILEELRRNISAREAQFVVKGPHTNYGSSDNGYRGGHGGGALGLGIQLGMGGLGVSGGRKHHPYKKEEVPYPRSYDREALDL
ncbi:hypothetical protein J3R30DRAFT_2115173 [Lentinula aciculospora]|uniref:Uncharacterized protein n=1 Tax=Lentinula aciculospora TaxID=153920 RepID=A0A9W9DQW0_9AGAR|nr:hypothetical protein J3R30DRAFT_2115173 [Lentinula aciculospora]